MSQAAFTGSSSKDLPKTLAPFSTVVPGTIGPKCLVQFGYFKANRPQPIVSIKQFLAVFKASSDTTL